MQANNKIIFKVSITGDVPVGKTCIIDRLINNKFDFDTNTTLGPTIHKCKEERYGQEIETQIWDNNGMMRSMVLQSHYYINSDAVILVFDLSDLDSFRHLDERMTTFQNIKGCDKTIFFLAGNKCDKIPCINDQDIEDWASKHNCRYFPTSALTGENITELFQTLVDTLIELNIHKFPEANSILLTDDTKNEKGIKKSCY